MVALLAGQRDPARRFFGETIAHDPRDVMARQWLAILEEEAGNPAQALRWCEEAQQLAPGDANTDDCVRRNKARLTAGAAGSRR
jgi:cytochrome c-type biogenesis protein CcmH/NrfG